MGAPRRAHGFLAAVIALVVVFVGLGSCHVMEPDHDAGPLTELAPPGSSAMPTTVTETLLENLEAPTALAIASDGTMVFATGKGLTMLDDSQQPVQLTHDLPGLIAEKGLLSLAVPLEFGSSQRLYLCYRTEVDLRVVPLDIDRDARQASADRPLVTGIPLPAEGQAGCQLTFGPDQNLYIGTSDGGQPRAPQDLSALGGKILRVDPMTRQAAVDNPFIDRSDAISKLVYSYGHRDVTGLAWSPLGETMYAIDRGPAREDEINVIIPGGNYGWNPASRSTTSYETDDVPMTDLAIANARPAAWNSGATAPQLGHALFVTGEHWGSLNGDLAVANAVGPRVLFMQVTGEIVDHPITLDNVNPVGPSASLAFSPDGDLYVLTANGANDRLMRVSVVA